MISWVAMDRIVERGISSDAKLRKRAAGRPLRSHARVLTDGELLARLRTFGIDLDRSSLERLCDQALSAEEIAKRLLDARSDQTERVRFDSDWIWICLATLWLRWFPDVPSFERLDDRMQAGYELLSSSGASAACRTWLDAWSDVLRILDKAGIRSIAEFDDRFGGTQSLFNWIQDFEGELWNAGLIDRQFLTARIAVCEEGLRRFGADDDLMTDNRRRALAESYFELGAVDRSEALCREWLRADPGWGWGWIGWSDHYRFTRTEARDEKKAEARLREGLSIPEVRNRADLCERLADLCEEQGRRDEAKELRRQARTEAVTRTPSIRSTLKVTRNGRVLRKKTLIDFGEQGVPFEELPNVTAQLPASPRPITASVRKVGRNDPCPCGSGRKFKKCCGGAPAA